MSRARVDYWNHNVHYQPVILGAAPANCTGLPVDRFYRALYRQNGPGAPVKDPDMTWAEVRATAARLLPGVRYRRHLLWRYSLLWTKR